MMPFVKAPSIVTGNTLIAITCPFCQKRYQIEVHTKDLERYEAGEHVQNAFPYVSADVREMFVSGICPTCWSNTFAINDDEEEDL